MLEAVRLTYCGGVRSLVPWASSAYCTVANAPVYWMGAVVFFLWPLVVWGHLRGRGDRS